MTCLRDVRERGSGALHDFSRIIEAISVRLPPGKTDSTTNSGRTWKLFREPGHGVQSHNISDDEFFERTDIKLSRPNAEFFRTCIRFDLKE
jgi:hypothetical protein